MLYLLKINSIYIIELAFWAWQHVPIFDVMINDIDIGQLSIIRIGVSYY